MRLATCLAVLAICGCTTYKVWSEFDSDPGAGTIQLAYEYRKFESPQVDERAGVNTARSRCADWGFKDAARKGEDRICLDGNDGDCRKWRVVREYRCLSKK
jgi:hypothetical protein